MNPWLRLITLVLVLFTSRLSAEDKSFIILKGHLGKSAVLEAQKKLKKNQGQQLVILVNSSSGDLDQVLNLARSLYEEKNTHGLKIVVYIEDNAVGPAAVIPFLADQLYTSIFVTWGDVPLGTEHAMPTNLLRNRVTSLISDDQPHAKLLTLMAEAMVDKNIMLVDDNGWKPYTSKIPPVYPIISPKGENLIVSHRELKKLDLLAGEMSLKEFVQKFSLPKTLDITPTESAAIAPQKTSLEKRLKKHIQYNPEGKNLVGRIVIDDRTAGITQGTWLMVKTALDDYKKSKPIFIILELNTPGGQVFAAQQISDALKEMDTQYGIPIVCKIDNWAISAGAMLAYSCRFITIVKDAAMGAAEPVMQSGEGMKTASEKVNSALRADFANRASFFGRNPLIAEAMVDKDMILVLRYGKFVKLDNEDQIRTQGPSPDIVISPKGKLLTLNANELMKYGVADMLMQPAKLPLITEKEKAAGQWPADKELLFHQPFFKDIPHATVKTYLPDWKTTFFSFLSHPIVSSVLFMGMLLGFYIEINTPGFGVPGTLGVVCLFLLLLSSFALEAVNWLELIIVGVGIALIAIDLFLIPSFGIVGGVGILLFIGGVVALLLPGLGKVHYDFDTNTFNAAGQFVFNRLAWLSLGFVVSLIVIALLARYVFPLLAPFNRFVLRGDEQAADKGYVSGVDQATLPQPGETGVAMTDMRPAGKVSVGDHLFEGVSDGGFIAKGAKVKVVGIEGSVIVVSGEK